MDTTQTITHVSLCAGYGGIDLGLKRAIPSLRTIAFSEIEAFACANLVAKMEAGLLDPAPLWTDLKSFPWADFHGCVDILSGGYPCQPFSAAGKRLGADDPRHLWPHISAGIALMRPSLCFFENVEGHITLGLSDVIEDLAGLGYRTTWILSSAAEVGAPHQRKRIFILAYYSGSRLQGHLAELLAAEERQKPSGPVAGSGGLGGTGDVAHADRAGSWQDRQSSQPWPAGLEQPSGDSWRSHPREIQERQAWPSRPGERQYDWEPPRVVANAECSKRRPSEPAGDVAHGDDAGRQQAPSGLRESSQAMGHAGMQEQCGLSDRLVGQTVAALGEPSSGLANATSTGSGSESRDALHEGRPTCSSWSESVSPDAERGSGAAIADHQSAGGDGRKLGNPAQQLHNGSGHAGAAGWGEPSDASQRQTQPPLGRDLDGPSGGVGYAELCVTCDNRTDELRLLGNGVVPRTAERAFRLMLGELMQ